MSAAGSPEPSIGRRSIVPVWSLPVAAVGDRSGSLSSSVPVPSATGASASLEVGLSLVPGVASALAAGWFATRLLDGTLVRDRNEHRRVAGWLAVGSAGFTAAAAGFLLVAGVDPLAPSLATAWVGALVTGASFGAVVGAYDVRSRRRERAERDALEARRETMAVLNDLLRHHLLNGLNVIDGHVDALEDRVDDDGRGDLRTIRARTDRMTETVQQLRRVATRLSDPPEPEPVELGPVLTAELERLRSRHPDVTVDPPREADREVDVLADDLLAVALSDVLGNAVQHNDADAPRLDVDVTADANGRVETNSVVVSVRDAALGPTAGPDGPGRLGGTDGVETAGDGLGLLTGAAIVDGYGGDVWIEEGVDGGAAVKIALPKAS